ncbi:MAG TPA: multicopper oxidase domain-containing protein [Candidatus Sulfotelmatobacter sp.]|nr:multicopper oxidase domain-containing protein [Candidatus Sulfotelmatobacter sp.]
MNPKNRSSWNWRLAALVCLACALVMFSVNVQTAGSKTSGGNIAQGTSAKRAGVAAQTASDAVASSAGTKHAVGGDGGCFRAAVGSEVPEPEDLRSVDGILKVDLAFRSFVDSKGEVRYCYVTLNGKQSPTLRVKPGDTVILNFKNEATAAPPQTRTSKAAARLGGAGAQAASAHTSMHANSGTTPGAPCATGAMKATSTNIHFHGLTVPATCHQDDVMHTMIETGSAPYEYRFQIPADEPPGLYWYHPHIHGFTKAQVLGGASAALVVEGIERAIPDLAGLPERILVIRDQNLSNPDAAPVEGTKLPPVVLDADGDVMNTGTGTGKPAEDLTLNYVPVPFPSYPPATITMKPGERQLWRVLNASAITYLSLQVLFGPQAQAVEVVALDGVPIHPKGPGLNQYILLTHLGVPPGGRIEFVMKGPPEGTKASLVTRSVNTGAMGENDPNRAIANIVANADAADPQSSLANNPVPLPASSTTWLRDVTPVRVRKLFFSETPLDPKDPNSPTTFYLTVDGETPKPFDPSSNIPNIVTHQGDVEDWILENRSQELHAFHIHQVHFALMEFFGLPVNEPFLRDTVNVPYWDGKNPVYPRVRLRMDFRDPNAVGTYPYHCHLLEHEDSGMMGLIRVEAK